MRAPPWQLLSVRQQTQFFASLSLAGSPGSQARWASDSFPCRRPIMAITHLTGPGLDSQKFAVMSGK